MRAQIHCLSGNAVTRSRIKSTSKMKSTFNHLNSNITIRNRSSYLSYKTENKCMNVCEEVKMEERIASVPEKNPDRKK